jgi:hypothetical protein
MRWTPLEPSTSVGPRITVFSIPCSMGGSCSSAALRGPLYRRSPGKPHPGSRHPRGNWSFEQAISRAEHILPERVPTKSQSADPANGARITATSAVCIDTSALQPAPISVMAGPAALNPSSTALFRIAPASSPQLKGTRERTAKSEIKTLMGTMTNMLIAPL